MHRPKCRATSSPKPSCKRGSAVDKILFNTFVTCWLADELVCCSLIVLSHNYFYNFIHLLNAKLCKKLFLPYNLDLTFRHAFLAPVFHMGRCSISRCAAHLRSRWCAGANGSLRNVQKVPWSRTCGSQTPFDFLFILYSSPLDLDWKRILINLSTQSPIDERVPIIVIKYLGIYNLINYCNAQCPNKEVPLAFGLLLLVYTQSQIFVANSPIGHSVTALSLASKASQNNSLRIRRLLLPPKF